MKQMACFYFHRNLISILRAQTSCLASDLLLFLFGFKNCTKVPSIYLCSMHLLYFSIHYFFYQLKEDIDGPAHFVSPCLSPAASHSLYSSPSSFSPSSAIAVAFTMSLSLFNHFISGLITIILATSPVSSISSSSSLFTLLHHSHSFQCQHHTNITSSWLPSPDSSSLLSKPSQ